MIIDMHIHIWRPEYIPLPIRWAFAEQAAFKRLPFRNPADILPKVTRGVSDPDGIYTIRDMDRAGIDAAVCLSVDFGVLAGQEPEVSIDQIHEHYSQLQRKYSGRLYAFASVDPRRKNGMEIFERAVDELGLRGLKLYTPCGFYPYDEACKPFYRKCLDAGLPVVFHTAVSGYPFLGWFANPLHICQVQREYPQLTIILAHAGYRAWWEEAVVVARDHPNTYLELSQWGEYALNNPEDFIKKLAYMRDSVGAHRILFATDYMAGPAITEEKSIWPRWVQFFKNLPTTASKYGFKFTEEEVNLILGGNAQRILKI
jgi:predicted TIM-barrel fold metal-dependent hydrolase